MEKEQEKEEQEWLDLTLLERNDRYCIAGAFACVLSKVQDLKDMNKEFHKKLLSILCKRLSLSDKEMESFLPIVITPISSQQNYVSPLPFLSQLFEKYSEENKSKNDKDLKKEENENEHEKKLKARIVIGLINLFLAELKGYDARVRVVLKALSKELQVDFFWFVFQENIYSSKLVKFLHNHNQSSQESTVNRINSSKTKRWLKIGTAAVLGGGILLVSGGLAAPAIAVGIGALGLTSAAVFLSTGVGIALVTSVFGASGAGLTGYKVNHVDAEVEEFKFNVLNDAKALSVVIAVNGILIDEKQAGGYVSEKVEEKETEKVETIDESIKISADSDSKELIQLDDSIKLSQVNQSNEPIQPNDKNGPYKFLSDMNPLEEQYCLQWETSALVTLGNALTTFAKKQAVSAIVKQGILQTAATTLLAAVAWPMTIISMADLIDNPWSVSISRADKAGLLLADALASKAHGERPVSLIGYSFGARVIVIALLELARRARAGEEDVDRLKGIVEDVYLLGTPFGADGSDWCDMRWLIAGRLVNGYASSDWMLSFMYRGTAFVGSGGTKGVAGLFPVEAVGVEVENVNLSSIVNGHFDYIEKLEDIMALVRYNDCFGMGGGGDVLERESGDDVKEEKEHKEVTVDDM